MRTSFTPPVSNWSRMKDATIKYSTVQNWYPGDKEGKGGIYNFVTKRGKCEGDNSKISLDTGRDGLARSPGSTRRAFCRATTASASFTRSR